MSMFSKIGSFFSIRDDEEEFYSEEPTSSRVVPLSNAGRRGGTQVSVFSPRSFQDVVEIADALRSRQVVIVNLQKAKYIDSAGVASLVEALKASRDLKSSFALYGLSRTARDVLELTRLVNVFEIHDDEQGALGNLGGASAG